MRKIWIPLIAVALALPAVIGCETPYEREAQERLDRNTEAQHRAIDRQHERAEDEIERQSEFDNNNTDDGFQQPVRPYEPVMP